MTIEEFAGTPTALQVRLAAIVGGGSTINDVIVTHQAGVYLIMYT